MQKKPKAKVPYKPRVVQNEHRLNNEITAPEIRLIRDGQEPIVCSVAEALVWAEEQEVDLETELNTMDEEYAPTDEDEPADASSTFISSPRATGKTKDPLLLLADW